MIKRRIYAFVAAAFFTAACSDITGPLGSDAGALSFRYAGPETGTFSASGVRPEDWGTRTHAAGLRLDSPTYTKVFAYALGSGGLANQFFLAGSAAAPGTYALTAEPGSEGTFYAELALEVSHANNTARAIYVLTSGSLTVEPEQRGRIRGRFEGTARLRNGTTTIHITDGRFDVPNNLPRPVD